MPLVIGWDISTAIIGVCVMDFESGKSIEYRALRVIGDTMLEKYASAETLIIGVLQALDMTKDWHHIIEDRLGGFSAGKTMQQTIMKLAQVNAVASHIINRFGSGTVTYLHPSTAKRIAGLKVPKGGDKKLEAIKLVRSLDGDFPYTQTKAGNPAVGVNDMADAWLLATSGRKLLRGEATVGEGKKAGGGHRKAGGTEAKVPIERRVRLRLPPP